MPSKKKKYNARFPAGRIKKIMQTDEEVGKVAQAVPVIISRTLELFVESLLTKSMQITQSRNAKTLTPSHMKQCILSESRFDFLKDLVKNIPDASAQEDNENNAIFEANIESKFEPIKTDDDCSINQQTEVIDLSSNFYAQQESTSSRTPVIQYGPKMGKFDKFSLDNLVEETEDVIPKVRITFEPTPTSINRFPNETQQSNPVSLIPNANIPPLVPFSQTMYTQQNNDDKLCIDEDYDQ